MFTNTLSKNAAAALALLGKSDILNNAYLAGGTACALQLGHRVSLDLDFFTTADADTQPLPKMLIPVSWEEVKKFFQSQTISLAKEKLKI